MKIKRRFGVTILELVIVVAVLGILASGIMIIIGRNSPAKARDGIRKADLKNIAGAVNGYYFSNNNQFPPAIGSGYDDKNVFTSDTNLPEWIPGLTKEMKTIPVDPKQAKISNYLARFGDFLSSVNNLFRLTSYEVSAQSSQTFYSTAADGYIGRLIAHESSFDPCDLYPDLSTIKVGQEKIGPVDVYNYRGFLSFDTSSLDDNLAIDSAVLRLTLSSKVVEQNFDLRIRHKDWGASLDCLDYVGNPPDPPVVSFQSSGLPASEQSFDINIPVSGINKSGVTYFMLSTNLEENDNTLGNGSYFAFYAAEAGGNIVPKLIIQPSEEPLPSEEPPPPALPCPYRYETTADRQDFVLWACLEISTDEHIWNKPTAACPKTSRWLQPPSGTGIPPYNFCIESR